MNIKKVVAVALILSSMTAVSASAAEFNDIKGHWAEEVINELADKDIIHGVSDTEFNPDGTVTRAEFLKMALGTVGIADVPYRSGECLDVTASDWYGGCVQSALDKGLIPENMIGNYAAKITDGKAIYSGFFDGDKPNVKKWRIWFICCINTVVMRRSLITYLLLSIYSLMM